MRMPATRRSLPVRGFATAGVAALGLTLAACDADDQVQPAPDGTPVDGAAQVAECVVGDWRATGVEGRFDGMASEGTVEGGAGVSLAIDPEGVATVDFAGMEPVRFDGVVAEVDVSGEVTYHGQASGAVRTDPDTTSGAWGPADTIDWSGVRVTADVAEPVEGRPLDETPIGDVIQEADEVTGDVIDVDPILGEGRFDCQDEVLVLRTETDAALTWNFTRA
jgi:hypothetical protein